MLWLPAASVEVVKDADPEDVVPVPIEVLPSKNVIVSPLGTVGLMVALNVTDDPDIDGLELEETVVAVTVDRRLIVWSTTFDVLPRLLESPA